MGHVNDERRKVQPRRVTSVNCHTPSVASAAVTTTGAEPTLEQRLDRLEEKVDWATALAAHQMMCFASGSSDPKYKVAGHCRCGHWDDTGKDTDVLLVMHRIHVKADMQPALFS